MAFKLRYAGILAAAVAIDALQIIATGALLFQAALCGIPSISGIGALATLACVVIPALGLTVSAAVNLFFSGMFNLAALWITKKRRWAAIGVVEAVPFLNALPFATASSIWYIIEDWKERK